MITCTINPAAGLTANKVPYALAGGRFADSGISYDPAANGSTTLTPNGTGSVRVIGAGNVNTNFGVFGVTYAFGKTDTTDRNVAAFTSNDGAGSHFKLLFTAKGAASHLDRIFEVKTSTEGVGDYGVLSIQPVGVTKIGGQTLHGTSTDSANGKSQLASHSALTGGRAWGTAADGTETIWRESAGQLKTAGVFNVGSLKVNGVTRLNTTQPDYTSSGLFTTVRDTSGASTAGDALNILDTLIRDLISIGILQ